MLYQWPLVDFGLQVRQQFRNMLDLVEDRAARMLGQKPTWIRPCPFAHVQRLK